MRCYEALVAITFVIPGTSAHLAAQWLKYPTTGVPRKAGGKVDIVFPPDAKTGDSIAPIPAGKK